VPFSHFCQLIYFSQLSVSRCEADFNADELQLSLLLFCHSSCFLAAVGADTESEHIRLNLALDEALDLKRSASSLCYNRQFVCV